MRRPSSASVDFSSRGAPCAFSGRYLCEVLAIFPAFCSASSSRVRYRRLARVTRPPIPLSSATLAEPVPGPTSPGPAPVSIPCCPGRRSRRSCGPWPCLQLLLLWLLGCACAPRRLPRPRGQLVPFVSLSSGLARPFFVSASLAVRFSAVFLSACVCLSVGFPLRCCPRPGCFSALSLRAMCPISRSHRPLSRPRSSTRPLAATPLRRRRVSLLLSFASPPLGHRGGFIPLSLPLSSSRLPPPAHACA